MKHKKEILTLDDVVKVLMDFDVRHQEKIFYSGMICNGLTIGGARDIQICDNTIFIERYEAVVHELLHAKYFRLGKNRTEREIEKMTAYNLRRIIK